MDRLAALDRIKLITRLSARCHYRCGDACFFFYSLGNQIVDLSAVGRPDHALGKTPFMFIIADEQNLVSTENDPTSTIANDHINLEKSKIYNKSILS